MLATHSAHNTTSLSLIGIYEISKILSSSFNLERTLSEVLNLLASYMQMRRGLVCLVQETGALGIVAAAGASPDAVRRGELHIGLGPMRSVVATGMPVILPDYRHEDAHADEVSPNLDDIDDDDRYGILDDEVVAFIGVPIKVADRVMGVLSIERIGDGSMSPNFEADVRFLAMIANLIGQNIRLHQVVASDRERLMNDRARLEDQLRESGQLKGPQSEGLSDGIQALVGRSPRLRDVIQQIRQVAPLKTTVLLRGESGTGKELVARAIHEESSRSCGPFIKLNCAALPETLLEAELFGHERGAFTGATAERKGRFELAHGGTLFLDEIGEISPAFQAKLLRVLQESEFERVGGAKTFKVDVRLVCATNRNLEEEVASGKFRADLYYRINVVPILLPPLRDRREDIPELAEHFMARFNAENNRDMELMPEVLDALQNCYFPGNVRELENCVYRVATLARGERVRAADLPCRSSVCLSAQLWKHQVDHALHAPPPVAAPRSSPANAPVNGAFNGSANGHQHYHAPANGSVNGGGHAPVNGAANGNPHYHPPAPGSAMPGSAPADMSAPAPLDPYSGADALLGDDPGLKDRLIAAMEKTGWVQAKAARLLGLTPRQVGYALRKFNVEIRRI